jgi:hypothetical protein
MTLGTSTPYSLVREPNKIGSQPANTRSRSATHAEAADYARRYRVRGQFRQVFDSYLVHCERGNQDDLQNSTECLQCESPHWFNRYLARR